MRRLTQSALLMQQIGERNTQEAEAFLLPKIRLAAETWGVDTDAIMGGSRERRATVARGWVAREAYLAGHPANAIARVLRVRHSTILRAAGPEGRAVAQHARLTEQAANEAARYGKLHAQRQRLEAILCMGVNTRQAFDAAREATREFPGLWREFCQHAYPCSWKAQAATPPGGA